MKTNVVVKENSVSLLEVCVCGFGVMYEESWNICA